MLRSSQFDGNRPLLRPRLIPLVFACLLTAPCCTAPAAQSKESKNAEETAEKYYSIGLASFHSGMPDDAGRQLKKAIAASPGHAPSRYLLGVISLQRGKAILDAVDYESCLMDPAADRQRARADVLHREAHESFRKAVEVSPEGSSARGRSYNSMSVVSLHFQELEKAGKEADLALDSEFYSERYSALANLGWAYYEQGDNVGALTELRQSVMLNPDFCVGRYRLARAYLQNKSYRRALEEIEKVTGDNRCPIQDALRVQGVAHLKLGQPDAARDSFQSCMALAPESCLARDCRSLYE